MQKSSWQNTFLLVTNKVDKKCVTYTADDLVNPVKSMQEDTVALGI